MAIINTNNDNTAQGARSSIVKSADQNRKIVETLHQTEYAKEDLERQEAVVDELHSKVHQLDGQAKTVTATSEKASKKAESIRESNVRKLLYKVACREPAFEAKKELKADKSRDAAQEEKRVRVELDGARKELDEAQKTKEGLQKDNGRNDEARKEQKELYEKIFDGDTPDFPEEDEKEEEVKRKLEAHRDGQKQLEAEKKALDLLFWAKSEFNVALHAGKSAQNASRFDMAGGGALTDLAERRELKKTQEHVNKAQQFLREARDLSKSGCIQQLSDTKVADGHVVGDVLFDNIFSDYSFHQNIKESMAEIREVADRVKSIIKDQTVAVTSLEDESKAAKAQVAAARNELRKERMAIFERVAGSD